MVLKSLFSFLFLSVSVFAAGSVPSQSYSVGSAQPFTGILHFKYSQRGHKLYLTNGAIALASCGIGLGTPVLTIHFVSPLRTSDFYIDPKVEMYKSELSFSKRYSGPQGCQANLLYLTSQPQASFSLDSNGDLMVGAATGN